MPWAAHWLRLLLLGIGLEAWGAGTNAARFPLERLSSGGYALLAANSPVQQPGARAQAEPASIQPAALNPGIGQNLRLGEDPAELPTGLRAQAEPHLARSFSNTNLFVAAFQEGRYADGGAVNNGCAISADGGRTWARKLIPSLIKTVDGGAFDRASDPVAGIDLANTIYLNSLAIRRVDGASVSTIVLSKSTDGGETFSRPLTVVTSATDAVFLDKNWMAINTFPGTRTAGRIAVTYTRFDSTPATANNNPIAITISDDEGHGWSPSRVISPLNCQGSQPLFLPDGSLTVVYWNFDGPAGSRIESVHSFNGGELFGPPAVVADVTLYSDPVARDGAFLPSAAADRSLGVIYVTYQAYAGGPRILFTRSADRGKTWITPIRVNDTPGNRSVFNPAIAVSPDGQHVTVIFYDKRNDDGSGQWVDLYLGESFDGGETWSPNLRVSSVSSNLGLAPLAPNKRMLGDYLGIVPSLSLEAPGAAVWIDTRGGAVDPYLSLVNRRQGSSFGTWQRLVFSASELAGTGVAGEEADPDSDGIPNLLEYALGLNPHDADARPETATRGPDGGSFKVELRLSRVASDVDLSWLETSALPLWNNASPKMEYADVEVRPDLLLYRASFTAPNAEGYYRVGAMLR